MLVQDRGTADATAKPSKPSPRALTYPDSPAHVKKSRNLSFSSSSSSCNTYKLVAIFILIASIAALFFLRGTIDGAALLCLDNRPTRPLPSRITYPDISWSAIRAIHAVDPAAVAPFASFRSERWIVVSVSTLPTDSLRLLVKTRGWQLLAVANSHTPADWSLKGAIFLSLDLQSRLGFRTVDFLPYASYVRKSIGYLFAIQHGAKIIYDADDRSDILGGDLSKHFDLDLDLGAAADAASGYPVLLQYSRAADINRTIVNPYVHFGQRSVWPRGLPLESVKEVGHEEFYSEIRGGRQFIQQGLSNGLPDVDSIFYFTRKSSRSEPYDILFDEDAPKVALPQGLMVPVNSFNTIFHSKAFWGLMLPVSVSSMASDVIRGYFAQRILWEIGGYVAVYPPTIHRQDRAEAYPFSDEKDLHVNVARLIKFLVTWRSTKPNAFERILDLSYAMANEGFWTEKDVLLTAAWLQDLISVGYQQPRLISLDHDKEKEASMQGDRREFVPRKISSIHLGVDESDSVNYEIGNLIRWRRSFGNVVLIMHCSGPVERTALEWRLLYGRIFKTVVILSEHNSTDLAVGYGELSIVYKYLPRVFAQFDTAEGFLFLQDSMVLNYWNLLQADKSRLWITNKVPQSWVSVSIDSKSSKWFVEQAAMVKKVVGTLPVHLQVSYKDGTNENELIICSSEVFYVPSHFVDDFANLVGLVGDLNMHHKVAVPLFFLAMDSQQNFDSDALSRIVYEKALPSNGSSLSYYTTKAPAVYPLKVQNEPDFIKLVQVMASGDPLLMELV